MLKLCFLSVKKTTLFKMSWKYYRFTHLVKLLTLGIIKKQKDNVVNL